jgi:hypothetical protein
MEIERVQAFMRKIASPNSLNRYIARVDGICRRTPSKVVENGMREVIDKEDRFDEMARLYLRATDLDDFYGIKAEVKQFRLDLYRTRIRDCFSKTEIEKSYDRATNFSRMAGPGVPKRADRYKQSLEKLTALLTASPEKYLDEEFSTFIKTLLQSESVGVISEENLDRLEEGLSRMAK